MFHVYHLTDAELPLIDLIKLVSRIVVYFKPALRLMRKVKKNWVVV